MVANVADGKSFQKQDGAWTMAGRSRKDEQAALDRGRVRCRIMNNRGEAREEAVNLERGIPGLFFLFHATKGPPMQSARQLIKG